MKKIFVVTLALFTVLSLGAFAQDTATTAKPATAKKSAKAATADTAATAKTTTKAPAAKKLMGKISDDGKSFTNSADQSSWTISNPDKVKGHEGHDVTIRATTDDAAKSLTVKSLTMTPAKSTTAKTTKKAPASKM